MLNIGIIVIISGFIIALFSYFFIFKLLERQMKNMNFFSENDDNNKDENDYKDFLYILKFTKTLVYGFCSCIIIAGIILYIIF